MYDTILNESTMSKAERDKLKDSQFGLPSERAIQYMIKIM